MKLLSGGKDYTIKFFYRDNYCTCTIEGIELDHSKNMFGFGETVKHPKDTPNRVIGRRIAFERAVEDFKHNFRGESQRYKIFRQDAWLCFVNSVNGRL